MPRSIADRGKYLLLQVIRNGSVYLVRADGCCRKPKGNTVRQGSSYVILMQELDALRELG